MSNANELFGGGKDKPKKTKQELADQNKTLKWVVGGLGLAFLGALYWGYRRGME